MARRIAQTNLNASTIDILNVIRQNAGYDYQQNVPVVSKATDIPKVGEIIYGTPAFANQFINSLVNRIAAVRIKSATFNNPYKNLKKGFLEYGETVEEIFVNIAKVVDYSAEKAGAREFKRTLPDVRSAFHTMNWRVMYPVTIQDEDLRMAFLSAEGVTDLISNIINQVYTAAEYDEFLLTKYLLIKAIAHGKIYPKAVNMGDIKNSAEAFRGASNKLTFMSNAYNTYGVKNNTPRERQVIFMDSDFNAKFDVEVLSAAFNMEKADFMGSLHLIDDWTTFDNERFEVIREASDGIEEVTSEELALLADVKAVLLDSDWFQIYDNLDKMTETVVSSGLYWNYFYHSWKTISSSPFANAIVFVDSTATTTLPNELTVEILSKDVSEAATVFTFAIDTEEASLQPSEVNFLQTEVLTTQGIAVQKFGALIIPADKSAIECTLVAEIGNTLYTASTTISSANNVGATVTLQKADS